MNRRGYLAAMGTAGSPFVAGCGFAHFAGAERDEITFPAPASAQLTARTGPELVIGQSGMGWIIDRRGERTFDAATRLRGVDRQGKTTWRAVLDATSDALAADERTYVLADDRVIAVEQTGDPDNRASEQIGNADIAWTVFGVDGGWPMAADGGHVYLSTEEAVVCYADSEEQWTTELAGAPQTIAAHVAGVIVATPDVLVGLDRTGETAWSTETAGAASLDIDRDDAAIRDRTEVWLAAAESGEEHWRDEIPSGGHVPHLDDDSVVVPTGEGTACYDRDAGDRLWQVADGHRPRPVYAISEETVYGATANGRVLAMADGEVRWTRTIADESGTPVDGWIDGDRIIFRYDSGRIRSFQREDQDVPWLI